MLASMTKRLVCPGELPNVSDNTHTFMKSDCSKCRPDNHMVLAAIKLHHEQKCNMAITNSWRQQIYSVYWTSVSSIYTQLLL